MKNKKIIKIGSAYAVFVFTFTLLSGFVAYAAPPQLTNQWKFDETVIGSTAVDSAGGNDALPTNNPVPSTDVAPVNFTNPRSSSFDGSNYYTINRPVSTDFTICSWVKTSSTGGGVNHWTSAPIMDSETGGVNYDFGFGIGNGGRLMFGNGGNDVVNGNLFDAQVNGTTQINDNTWHNVCVTRNNTTGLVKLYVDAQLDGSGVTGIGALTSNPNARMGYGYDGAALFQGNLDDVRTYDTDLTQQQLQVITNGGNNPLSLSIVFDEQGGTDVADITGLQPGDTAILPGTSTRNGYVFSSWNTRADGTGTSYAGGANYTVVNNDTILYAIFTPAETDGQSTNTMPGVPNTGARSSFVINAVGSLAFGLLLTLYTIVQIRRTFTRNE